VCCRKEKTKKEIKRRKTRKIMKRVKGRAKKWWRKRSLG
jgi:hypothetical protein